MLSFPKLLLTTLVATSLTPVASWYKGCADPTTPPKYDKPYERCPSGYYVTVADFLKCTSGPVDESFDDNDEDFDIVYSLIAELGLSDALANFKGTFFLPKDGGFRELAYDLAKEKKYYLPYSYGEEDIKNFLIYKLGGDFLTKVLKYHLSDDEKKYSFEMLFNGEKIPTLAGEAILISMKAHATPSCDERVRLVDEFRSYIMPDWRFAKIDNKFKDIKLKNVVVHVSKRVLLPKPDDYYN